MVAGSSVAQVADVLAQGAVDVDLAGDRDAARGQPRVDVAGDEAEIALESRPALVGEDAVLRRAEVRLHELEQGHLELGQLVEDVGVVVAGAEFLGHVGGDGLDLGIALGLAEDVVEVELAVLHDLDAEVVEGLDRRVAGQEVLRPRARRRRS